MPDTVEKSFVDISSFNPHVSSVRLIKLFVFHPHLSGKKTGRRVVK